MLRLEASQRKNLESAAQKYHANLDAVLPYLESRGIPEPVAEQYQLGLVAEPFSIDHERYVGRLSIPYLTRAGVVGIRFRCLEQHDCKESGCAKYLSPKNYPVSLYNVNSLFVRGDILVLTEGELDAVVCSAMVGVAAVGVPGVDAWRPHWSLCVSDFQTVLVAADGDKAGRGMVDRITDSVPNAIGRLFPEGHDVTSLYLAEGRQGVLKALGIEG